MHCTYKHITVLSGMHAMDYQHFPFLELTCDTAVFASTAAQAASSGMLDAELQSFSLHKGPSSLPQG